MYYLLYLLFHNPYNFFIISLLYNIINTIRLFIIVSRNYIAVITFHMCPKLLQSKTLIYV